LGGVLFGYLIKVVGAHAGFAFVEEGGGVGVGKEGVLVAVVEAYLFEL
jgi:hypothetical protein